MLSLTALRLMEYVLCAVPIRLHQAGHDGSSMSRNEAQTRFDLIDPAILTRGWERVDIRLEETAAAVDIVEHRGQKQGRRRPKGRTDYVLRRPLTEGTEPLPLAIIEAKREGLPPEHGLQQGKGYRVGHLHAVPFVFSSNGHQFVEYDEETGITSEAKLMSEFPTPEELLERYLRKQQLPTSPEALKLLQTPYHLGRGHLRYYQDAAIRTALEKIIRQQAAGEAPRVLLSLATGSGKTRLAASLLRRLFDAKLVGKALFVCDRKELRDNGLGDFQEAFGTDAAEVDTRNPQKNAKVAVATFQTLDHSDQDSDVTFFLKHYPPGYFDVIVIDECHRSAWGEWFAVLDNNKQAIQVGLTATPREIELPEADDKDLKSQIERDRQLRAHNLKYFGDETYEYSYLQGVADGYLAPVDIETYDLFHDHQVLPERKRGVKATDLQSKRLSDALTGQRLPSTAAKNFCDCLPRRSEQRNWLSGSSCLGEEFEGVAAELVAGEQD